jgi:uncharacterized membrane protein YeiH
MPTHFLYIIDILGTISFAVSGAFLAMEKKLDPFGVLVLAFVTAIGGGTLRDMMIGNLPVSWLTNSTATIVIFGRYLKHLTTTLFLFDALGLGLFTIVGIKLGIEKNFSIGVCITLGTITACFGGVVRDVLLNNIPLLFRKEIYGLIYFLLRQLKMDADAVTIICILIIFIIRIIAVRYKISLPQFYNSAKE